MSRLSPNNPEFSTALQRDDYIEGLVGIRPDQRHRIPAAEVAEMVRGIQADDHQAMEELVATRLVWILEEYANQEEIRSRSDLEDTDILQIGSMATIEAAQHINLEGSDITNALHNKIPRLMDGMVLGTKLIPAFGENSKKVSSLGAMKEHKNRMTDNAIPVGTETDVRRKDPTEEVRVGDDPYDILLAVHANTALREGIEQLDDRLQAIVLTRFFGRAAHDAHKQPTYREIGQMFELSHERIRQLEELAIDRLRKFLIGRQAVHFFVGNPEFDKPSLEERLRPYRTVTSIPESNQASGPHWSEEQLALQKLWLMEIATKQENGQAAFVTGNLQTRPLPWQVEKYLQVGYFNGETGGAALRAALESAEEERIFPKQL